MTDLVDAYRQKMCRNIAGVEQAQRLFAQVTAEYRDRFPDSVTAEYQARSDPRRRQAIGDDQYHTGLAVMYGVAALVEICLKHEEDR